MAYIWDPEKEADNIREHKIRFDVAAHVFDDPLRVTRHDDDSSINEERYQTIGIAGEMLFVVYTEVGDEDTRIISARLAETKERRIYYERDDKIQLYGWSRVNP